MPKYEVTVRVNFRGSVRDVVEVDADNEELAGTQAEAEALSLLKETAGGNWVNYDEIDGRALQIKRID